VPCFVLLRLRSADITIRQLTARLQVDVRFLFPATSRLAHMTFSHRLLDAADAIHGESPEIPRMAFYQ